jgi:hypothetical protein
LVGRRGHPDRDGESEDDHHLDHVEEERHRQTLADLLEHGPTVGEGAAEIQPHDAAQPCPVLHGYGLVETVDLTERLLGFLDPLPCPFGRHDDVGGIARREMDHHEGDEGDPDEEGNGKNHPPEHVGQHGGLF